MHASTDGHPDFAQLVAYADGEADVETVAHIRSCSRCAAEAGELAGTQAMLRRSLYRFDCPEPLTLGEYLLDLLEPGERQHVAAHVLECDECRTEQHSLRSYLATEPPVPEPFMARVRRLVASLVAPPAAGVALAGLRGGAETSTRLYQVDGVTISVASNQPGGLVGLIVVADRPSEALRGREVRLVPLHGEPYVSEVDEFGNFSFSAVPSAAYALELHLEDEIIVVEELTIA